VLLLTLVPLGSSVHGLFPLLLLLLLLQSALAAREARLHLLSSAYLLHSSLCCKKCLQCSNEGLEQEA
jgi:hypothetical protein